MAYTVLETIGGSNVASLRQQFRSDHHHDHAQNRRHAVDGRSSTTSDPTVYTTTNPTGAHLQRARLRLRPHRSNTAARNTSAASTATTACSRAVGVTSASSTGGRSQHDDRRPASAPRPTRPRPTATPAATAMPSSPDRNDRPDARRLLRARHATPKASPSADGHAATLRPARRHATRHCLDPRVQGKAQPEPTVSSQQLQAGSEEMPHIPKSSVR